MRTFGNIKIITVLILIALSLYSSTNAQAVGGGGEGNPILKTNAQSLKNWQDMRFGMFIHWGPVSLRGTEIGWSRATEVPMNEYDNLYKEFNPALFNAKEWVATAKAAGMKYIVIVSKHHDGFCMFDSKYTDHKITNTPFKRDVLKELSDECRKQGIMFCTYYSILDWYQPFYTTRHGADPRPVFSGDMFRYVEYLKNQINELITKYKTNLLWFDGEWENSWTHENGMDLYAYAKKLNDKILINNRVDKGNIYYKDKASVYAGDFDTPEQEIGEFNPNVPWESCITICNQWAWKPNDKMKSLKECIKTLVRTSGGGGNLLFNVGPMLDGRIEQRQIDRLKEMGAWLKKYGESIYGTQGGPYKPNEWFSSTNKDNRIYIHLTTLPRNVLVLNNLPDRLIKNIQILKGDKLTWKTEESRLLIDMPLKMADENCMVIVIELDKPVKGIQAMDIPQNLILDVDSESIKLKSNPSPKYAGDGVKTLIDKERGSDSFSDGGWLGFEGEDFEATIDLKTQKPISKVKAGFLDDQNSWIFFPKTFEVFVSNDDKDYKSAGKVTLGEPKGNNGASVKDLEVKFKTMDVRYIKIKAEGVKTCPDWHKGAGGKAWIFIDEIMID